MLDIPWDGGPRRDLVVAGVDIGGTKVTAVLAGADGVDSGTLGRDLDRLLNRCRERRAQERQR